MSKDHIFKMRFARSEPEFGQFKLSETDQKKFVVSDGFLYSSIRKEPGGTEVVFSGTDGDTRGPLALNSQFWIFAALAHHLSVQSELDPSKRHLCRVVHETILEAVATSRAPVRTDA